MYCMPSLLLVIPTLFILMNRRTNEWRERSESTRWLYAFGAPYALQCYMASMNFDNPTKRKYAIERYQMFLWIFEKKNSRKCQKSPFFGATCANR